MTEGQRKVKIFIIKSNSGVEITRFTRIDEQYNNQGSMIKFYKNTTKTQVHWYTHCLG